MIIQEVKGPTASRRRARPPAGVQRWRSDADSCGHLLINKAALLRSEVEQHSTHALWLLGAACLDVLKRCTRQIDGKGYLAHRHAGRLQVLHSLLPLVHGA